MYEDKENNYFENVRKELLDLIPEKNKNGNMLEIGAGEGNTLLYAKNNDYAKNIYGVELFEIKNSNQTNELLNDFIIGNIENIELPFDDSQFDVMILGDVLEHLVDPYSVVQKLKKYLKDDGVIISSIPNIREWNTMKTIFFNGDFKYEESGILDKTHLRFFTRKNIIELFENNGFNIKQIIGSNQNEIDAKIFLIKKYLKRLRILRIIKLFKSFKYLFISNEFFHIQYFTVATKKNL